KIILIIIIIIFQFILSVRDAVKKIPIELVMFEKSLDLNVYNRFFHFILPAILPAVFTSLRINIGISIAVLFFSESFATKYGIGYFIMNNWVMANYLDMFSAILGVSLLGVVLFAIVDLVEKKICHYQL
ncbi:MAG: ABC transporter permease subunit, partial [Oscillospiraceae bacterium]|nr:ABC transporter permease subunit [Oscillospiraceae bacterium]